MQENHRRRAEGKPPLGRRKEKVAIPTEDEFVADGIAMFGKDDAYWRAEFRRLMTGGGDGTESGQADAAD